MSQAGERSAAVPGCGEGAVSRQGPALGHPEADPVLLPGLVTTGSVPAAFPAATHPLEFCLFHHFRLQGWDSHLCLCSTHLKGLGCSGSPAEPLQCKQHVCSKG